MTKDVTFEEVHDAILELLVKETGLTKEFFENASIKEVENALGIPRYFIVDEPINKRAGYNPFKTDCDYHFDLMLLYK